MPRLRERADEPVRAARAPASRRAGPAAWTFDARTSVSTAAARKAASISSSSAARMRPSMSARSSASVSNSLARAGELVVDLGQHLLVDVLHRDVDRRSRAVGELVA